MTRVVFCSATQGILFRQVNRSYETDYRLLQESGLYDL